MSGLTLTATALAGMVLGCAVVGGLGQVAVARAGVDAAADLAALGAAAHLARGQPSDAACGVATSVVANDPASDRSLVGCTVTGPTVTVTVGAAVRVLGVAGTVTGRARAGPVRDALVP